MTNIEELWNAALDETVARVAQSSGTDPANWRTAGRATKDKPNGDDLDFWRADGLRQLEAYAEFLRTTDWLIVDFDGEPAVEMPVSCEFSGISVRGFIDAVYANGDGELVVVDYKTGSRTPDSMLQLGLYAASLEVMGYPRPSLGAFWMTRKAEMTEPESLARFTPHFWGEMFSMFRTAVDESIFIPNVGSHCRSCGVKDACAAVGGTDAYLFDPLHPSYHQMQDANKGETK